MHHYTYLIQSLDKTMNYIGVRSCRCLIEQDIYWGTSKHLPWGRAGAKKDQSSVAIKTILKTFSTRKEAVEHEVYLHALYNVSTNPNFWNQANQTSSKFDVTGKTFIFTKQHIENMKKGHLSRSKDSYSKNWKHSDQAKQSIANSKRNIPRSEEVRTKLSYKMKVYYQNGGVHPLQGKQHSNKTKEKISKVRKEKGLSAGINAVRFNPWFITYPDGTTEVFTDITKTDKAKEQGYHSHVYLTAAGLSKGKKVIKKGQFKGCIVGNMT